jgi:hypothetical protein
MSYEIKKLKCSIAYYNSEQARKLILELQTKIDLVNKILDEPHVKLIKHPDIERLREALK